MSVIESDNLNYWMPALVAVLLLLPARLPAEDLVAVYNLARDNDPKFRAAESTYLAERQRLPQARAALLPHLSASASRDSDDIETRTDAGIVSRPAGQAKFRTTEYELSLKLPLYNRALFAELHQAHATVRRAEAEYATAGQELILRVAEAYFGVLAAQDSVELAHAEKSSIRRQLETAEARLKVGLATITDVHDARARYEAAAAEAIGAENQLQDKREALREITGRSFATLTRVGPAMPLLAPEPADIQQWVDKSLAQNYALLARREAVENAREEVKRRRAGHWPSLDLVGTRTRENAEGSITGPGVRTDDTTVSVRLNVPLFQGGLVSAQTSEAAHRYDASQQELESARRATERAARAAYLGVESGAAKVTALTQAVVASESALAAKTEGFAAGISTNLDVLNASRDLYRAKRDLATARYDYLQNLLRLKQAAGTLSERDLAQINRWLR